jgi:L-alanine-DL-glutamate epimerase-like enolase superfamily enzyme
MEKITRIELFHVSIPLPKPFYPSWIPGYPSSHCNMTLIRLTTGSGITGISAGYAMEQEREGLGNLLGPYLIGLDASNIPLVKQRLREAGYLGWRNVWIEAAFWDILGKLKEQPLYKLINPDSPIIDKISVYCSTGEIHSHDQRRQELLRIKEMGFAGVKMRVHDFEISKDIAHIELARKTLGEDFIIGVDANQGWRVTIIDDAPAWNLERAADFAKACEALGIAWLEEPLDMYAWDELAELRKRTKTKIAGGELNAGWHEMKIFLEKGSFDNYQPDATFNGGVSDCWRVAQECLDRNLDFSPHTWTNGIGFLINLHIHTAAGAKTLLEYPYEPPGWVPESRDGILAEPIYTDSKGQVEVPQAPGLGIRLDEDKMKRYAVKFFDITEAGIAWKTIKTKGFFSALGLAKKKTKIMMTFRFK